MTLFSILQRFNKSLERYLTTSLKVQELTEHQTTMRQLILKASEEGCIHDEHSQRWYCDHCLLGGPALDWRSGYNKICGLPHEYSK